MLLEFARVACFPAQLRRCENMEENLCRFSQCLIQASQVVQELAADNGENVAAVVNDDEASTSTNCDDRFSLANWKTESSWTAQ